MKIILTDWETGAELFTIHYASDSDSGLLPRVGEFVQLKSRTLKVIKITHGFDQQFNRTVTVELGGVLQDHD